MGGSGKGFGGGGVRGGRPFCGSRRVCVCRSLSGVLRCVEHVVFLFVVV
jgi:hypothetical protein